MDKNGDWLRRRSQAISGGAALALILGFMLYWIAPAYSQTSPRSITCYSVVTVQSERDLSVLAQRYHTTVEQILRENPQYKTIRAGTTLTIRENYLEDKLSRGLSGGWTWPLQGSLTSGYGSRDGEVHHGVDIAAPSGMTVRAARSGRVVKAGWLPVYGLSVVIDHGNGVETLYSHNSQILVRVGEWVQSGERIAMSGNTGKSTGPHLHFEVRLGGQTLDPLRVIPKILMASE